jgi:hypothetical protein
VAGVLLARATKVVDPYAATAMVYDQEDWHGTSSATAAKESWVLLLI